MKNWMIALALLIAAAPARGDGEPTTVRSVDLSRYAGLWYEVAKIPNRFQDQCVRGTTAEYSIREDGQIDVLNSCTTESGEVDAAEGLAKIVEAETNAKLKVSFVSFFGWRPFWGDYWILGLGDEYEYAIVGSPDRKYGWVLSRTPELSATVLAGIYEQLEAQGFDPADFEQSLP